MIKSADLQQELCKYMTKYTVMYIMDLERTLYLYVYQIM